MIESFRGRALSGVLALVLLAGLAALSLAYVAPPAPAPADAPTGEFSADRAYQHVQRIGQHEHPVGSTAAVGVHDYIVSTLSDMGLQPQTQDAVAGTHDLSGPYAMAHVRNVVALLRGTASTGRVVMFAHYDSVQVSFGGNDDGAGVATLLETARALLAGPPPVNDIVFLFTDGEEACICGAEAFVTQSPLAAGGGVALNFESRGTTGPAVMFETSRGNSDLIDAYAGAVPYPVATSFAVEVYRILPNDTDFTPFRESGRFTGLNTAYIDGSAVYHAPEDKPATMDLASLENHGANALALAHAFGAADIARLEVPSAQDATYFPVLTVLARYPGWLVWPLAALGVLAVVGLAVAARRAGRSSWPRAAAGFGLALVPLVFAAAAAQVLWSLLVLVRPGYGNMMDPWWPGWFRVTVLALVATIVLTWYGLLRRPVGAWPLAIGGLGWLAALGVLLAAVAPGGSYLAALPAIAGGVGGLVAVSVQRPLLRLIAETLAGAVAVLILAPTVYLFFPALGLETGAAAALFAAMLGLALLPVLEWLYPVVPPHGPAAAGAKPEPAGSPRAPRRWAAAVPALTAGALALISLGAGLAVDHFDTAHPAPAHLAYVLDRDTARARWVSEDADPGEWVSQYVTGTEDLAASFGLMKDGVHTGPAAPVGLPAPRVTVAADRSSGGRRLLTVTVAPQRAVRLIYLDVPDTTVLGATVDGRELPAGELGSAEPGGRFRVVFHAPSRDGVTYALTLGTAGPTRIRVADGSDGLGAVPGFVPRPPDVGIRGSHTSELLVVAKSYSV